MSDRGAFNAVNLLLVLGVAAAGYFAWIYVPLYVDDYAVKQAVRRGCNLAYSDRRESAVRASILSGVKEIGMRNEEIAADGSILSRPLPFDDGNFSVTLTESPPEISVELYYEREIVWPFLKQPKTVAFSFEHTEDLRPIRY